MLKHLLFCCLLLGVVGCATKTSDQRSAEKRVANIRGALGTYGNPPRKQSRHVDIDRLLAELKEINANTYHWLQRTDADWQDFKEFLPRARRQNLKVWITLLPPSEPPPSQPFQLDFIKWAEEIATLSKTNLNLVAWSIDDFPYNLKQFTPEYVKTMVGHAHAINPSLAFVPCCYFRQLTPKFVANYKESLDGVLFPYRADSAGGNLTDPTLVETEVTKLRELFGQNYPIILDVYATAHSRLGPSAPEYVEEVIRHGNKSCDGVLIYCHQDPKKNADKYLVLKRSLAAKR